MTLKILLAVLLAPGISVFGTKGTFAFAPNSNAGTFSVAL